ncbi:hypothetical protein PRVXH_001819 [Proteinivorax hydrogeniformans]|uniref:AAA domain-containing protein n=1 Tax=Proteinivorax hydrogeniformans TaxID=1826727 RepID=A0AAU8HR72_9FIRM
MTDKIKKALDSMGHRKMLFILGDHGSGKTPLVKKYLTEVYGANAKNHYIDVGMYVQQKIADEKLRLYERFSEEFRADAEEIFSGLVEREYKNKNLIVFDHMEFLLSEDYIGWIKILDKVTLSEKKALVVVPTEYEKGLPLRAYKKIKL